MKQGLHKYIIWFVATLYVVYSFCLNTASAVFSDAIKASLKVSNLGVSLATGAFILGFACMQIPAGYLLDKFNAKYIVNLGVLLLALGNLAISFADNLCFFALSNFIQGIGASFAFVAAAVLVSQWFSRDKFPIFFGLTQTFACVLSGIIHYYLMVALKSYPWNFIYQKLALGGFALLLLSLFFVESPKNYDYKQGLSLKKSLGEVLKNKQILLCSLAAATSFGVLLAYAGLWYMTVESFYEVENLEAAIISAIIFIGVGVGTPLLGWYSNFVKSRVMIIHLSLVSGTMALLLCLYSPHLDIDTLIVIKIIAFLTGFFLSGSMLFYTLVSEISTVSVRGVALSVLNTAVFLFNTAMLFIPYLFVTEVSKDFFTYLWILPFCIMFSILVLYFIRDIDH